VKATLLLVEHKHGGKIVNHCDYKNFIALKMNFICLIYTNYSLFVLTVALWSGAIYRFTSITRKVRVWKCV